MIRCCVICGAEFDTPPSNNKRTCSPACSKIWRSKRHIGVSNKWSTAARDSARIAADRTGNLQNGTAAALKLPEGQRGPQNRESKVWHLVDPDGNIVIAVNLLDWARKHAKDYFDMDTTDENATRIASGFRQIKRSIAGKRFRADGKPAPVSTYKGWGLLAWEDKKEDTP